MTDRENKALDLLHNGVRQTLTSESWRAALELSAKFHNYSWNNLMLISYQRPGATQVAGYRKWQELKRQVRRGERGIDILAPILVWRTDEETGERRQVLVGFKSVRVFDVAQTDGPPLPRKPAPKWLQGHEDISCIINNLIKGFIAARGWTLEETCPQGALGYWNPDTKTVGIAQNLSTVQRVKTLIHEIAHALLDHTGAVDADTYRLCELEAESAAFLTLDALGIDASDYSFAYLAHWAGSEDEMTKVMQAGQKALKISRQIVEALAQQGLAAAA